MSRTHCEALRPRRLAARWLRRRELISLSVVLASCGSVGRARGVLRCIPRHASYVIRRLISRPSAKSRVGVSQASEGGQVQEAATAPADPFRCCWKSMWEALISVNRRRGPTSMLASRRFGSWWRPNEVLGFWVDPACSPAASACFPAHARLPAPSGSDFGGEAALKDTDKVPRIGSRPRQPIEAWKPLDRPNLSLGFLFPGELPVERSS